MNRQPCCSLKPLQFDKVWLSVRIYVYVCVPGPTKKSLHFHMKCKAAGTLLRRRVCDSFHGAGNEASLAARPLLYIMAAMLYRDVVHITICVFSAWPRRSVGTPGSVPEVRVLLEEERGAFLPGDF